MKTSRFISSSENAANNAYSTPVNITIMATAADSDGTIAKVEFFDNGTLLATSTAVPYGYVWNNVPGGAHQITAKATDDFGDSTTSTVAITVNSSPTVNLTSPVNGASFGAPGNIPLTANVTDVDGSVLQVNYYANENLVGSSLTVPWMFNWSNVPAGRYRITAQAIDNLGATTTSSAVTITVGVPPPEALYYIHTDHLNTPRLVADATGTTVWRWDQQEPFGASVPDENPSGLGAFELPIRFQGQYFDKETNVHYNYFRNYDPSLGRYEESDPIGLKAGLNTYLYVSANPLRMSDPMGLAEGCDFIPDRFETPCRLVCCTFHDQCWSRHRCDMWSWCPGRGSPACSKCNLDVVECFIHCGKDGRGGRGR